jgi:hypothetical protein
MRKEPKMQGDYGKRRAVFRTARTLLDEVTHHGSASKKNFEAYRDSLAKAKSSF